MMPATSDKQKKFMDAVAHNPAFAKKVGVPKAVGKDFSEASKGMKFKGGPKSRADSQAINRPKTNQGSTELFKQGGKTMATKMNPGFMAMMAKKKAGTKKMAEGGMPMKDGKPAFVGDGKGKMASGGMAKKMAFGGSVDAGNSKSMGKVRTASPSKDGVASKGKTKGKQIVMAGNKGMKKGGMAC